MVWAWIILAVAAAGAFLAGKSFLGGSVSSVSSNLLSNPILWGLGLLAAWFLLRRGSGGSGTTNIYVKGSDDDTYVGRKRWK